MGLEGTWVKSRAQWNLTPNALIYMNKSDFFNYAVTESGKLYKKYEMFITAFTQNSVISRDGA